MKDPGFIVYEPGSAHLTDFCVRIRAAARALCVLHRLRVAVTAAGMYASIPCAAARITALAGTVAAACGSAFRISRGCDIRVGRRFRWMVPVSTPSVELSPVRVCGRYHFPFARGGLFSSRYRHQPQVSVSADWRRPMVGDTMQSYGAEKGMDCDFSEMQMLKCVNGLCAVRRMRSAGDVE